MFKMNHRISSVDSEEASEEQKALTAATQASKTKFDSRARLVIIFGVGFAVGVIAIIGLFQREFDSSVSLRSSALASIDEKTFVEPTYSQSPNATLRKKVEATNFVRTPTIKLTPKPVNGTIVSKFKEKPAAAINATLAPASKPSPPTPTATKAPGMSTSKPTISAKDSKKPTSKPIAAPAKPTSDSLASITAALKETGAKENEEQQPKSSATAPTTAKDSTKGTTTASSSSSKDGSASALASQLKAYGNM